jgi:hypothetical protein
LDAFGNVGAKLCAWLLEDTITFETLKTARGHLHLWEYREKISEQKSEK